MSAEIAVKVDPGNTEQARAWDGNEGAYWADNAEYFDRSIAGYDVAFMAAADVSEHDHVLDIGCGTGKTTRDAARAASSGSALGVDLSSHMIAYAGQVSAREGPPNASFEQADAQVHPFIAEVFDVAISRTGAMFFGDPVAAFTNIARAVRRGGRLALLTWQAPEANEWIRAFSTAMAAGRDLRTPPPDAPGPFSLADPERVQTVLGASGFTDIQLEPHSEAMWFGADADDAQRFVLGLLGWMLEGLDDEGMRRALDNLTATLTAHDTGHGVLYGSAAWTIRATRPGKRDSNDPVRRHP
ncbi:MAG TPA: class I SAM-dependent methyltransferase [Kribbella sp.]|uniref:class I SAM-dependent methyltransferase n=1 Tax=Kribbella sp. TaxID=1871183 RepID=UPI002D78B79C|nr:class I SAM-dependent methyltransferase [Kribbella sp.]HET6297502.1 class I SAM-dependent methyltransferase [Kribbella sp.]